ncbi:MAG TPA: hypothetical protein VFM05_05575 [Candidatus Saccharimonadales bacterium]|nr:hypothetical protein [Candidatus Saccharimonadales bacterium]
MSFDTGYPPHQYPHPEWEREFVSRPGDPGDGSDDMPPDDTDPLAAEEETPDTDIPDDPDL